jgi:hypothetical protein
VNLQASPAKVAEQLGVGSAAILLCVGKRREAVERPVVVDASRELQNGFVYLD